MVQTCSFMASERFSLVLVNFCSTLQSLYIWLYLRVLWWQDPVFFLWLENKLASLFKLYENTINPVHHWTTLAANTCILHSLLDVVFLVSLIWEGILLCVSANPGVWTWVAPVSASSKVLGLEAWANLTLLFCLEVDFTRSHLSLFF